jgi:signal transduction histidine kinase
MSDEAIRMSSQEIADELARWRVWLLDTVLVVALVTGLFALAPTLLAAIHDPAERPAAMAYSTIFLVGVGLLLARRLGARWRIVGLLAAAYAVSAIDMARGGLAGSGRVYWLVCIALTTAFFGWRAGIAAGAAGLAVYAGLAAVVLRGWLIPLPLTDQWWVSEGIDLAMAITLLVLAQASFVRAHQQVLERACQAEEQLTLTHLRQLHIARDLHDETVQQMYGVVIVLRRAILDVQRYPEQSVARLTYALDLSIRAWQGLRDHLQSLRRPPFRRASLPSLPQRGYDARANWPDEPVPFDIQMALTRIVQEALSNVYRHSRATQVSVEMRLDGGQIQVDVRDNGAGFNPAGSGSRSFGLADLRDQIAALGGALTIDSAPGAGTRLSATIPAGVHQHEQ